MRLPTAIAATLLLAPAARAQDFPQWPRSPAELQVRLQVLFALEDGPLVCRVTLKNVSSRLLHVGVGPFTRGDFCTTPAAWKPRLEMPQVMPVSGLIPRPHPRELRPGEALASDVYYLHARHLAIPAGKADIECGWKIHRTVDDPEHPRWTRLEPLFTVTAPQAVEVPSATAPNVARLARALTLEFDAVAATVRVASDQSQVQAASVPWVNTITGTYHPEFAPLLMRALTTLPDGCGQRSLIATLYDSGARPADGFDVLAAHLAGPDPTAADHLFDYWAHEALQHQNSRWRRDVLRGDLARRLPAGERKWLERKEVRDALARNEEAWRQSKRHLDSRLTVRQAARLRALPNVWMRARLYADHPDLCPPGWAEDLLRDLAHVVRPPADLPALLAQLDDDHYAVREAATAELLRLGPAWDATFHAALTAGPSAEATRRLRWIRARLGEPKLPPLTAYTLGRLARRHEDLHVRRMLDVLTSHQPPNRIAQAAREAWAARRRAEEERGRAWGAVGK